MSENNINESTEEQKVLKYGSSGVHKRKAPTSTHEHNMEQIIEDVREIMIH